MRGHSEVPATKTVADLFFVEALRSSLGENAAQAWLASITRCAPSPTSMSLQLSFGTSCKSGANTYPGAASRHSCVAAAARRRTRHIAPSWSSVADLFVFEELRASGGCGLARAWLASTCAGSCLSPAHASLVPAGALSATSTEFCPRSWPHSSSPAISSENSTQHRLRCPFLGAHSEPTDRGSESEDNFDVDNHDVASLMQEHGANAGLLFTDAAHMVLDLSRFRDSTPRAPSDFPELCMLSDTETDNSDPDAVVSLVEDLCSISLSENSQVRSGGGGLRETEGKIALQSLDIRKRRANTHTRDIDAVVYSILFGCTHPAAFKFEHE